MEFCLTVLAIALVYWLFNGLTFLQGGKAAAPCREQSAVRRGQGAPAGGRGRVIFQQRTAWLRSESSAIRFDFPNLSIGGLRRDPPLPRQLFRRPFFLNFRCAAARQ